MKQLWANFRERWRERRERFSLAARWYIGYCFFVVNSTIGRMIGGWLGWWEMRAFRLLLGGLPALVALIALPVFAISLPSNVDLAQHYAQSAKTCKHKKDVAGTILCYERMTQLTPGHAPSLFELGLALDAAGKSDRAKNIIEALAFAEEPGYPLAHVWQARNLLRGTVSRAAQRFAEKHLVFALRQTAELPEASALLGELYFAQQRYREAEPHLRTALASRPDLRLAVAKANVMIGRTSVARLYAEQSQRHYEDQVRTDPGDVRSRLAWAEATLFLENFDKAIEILQQGLRDGGPKSEQAVLHRVLSRSYLLLAEKAKGDLGERMEYLELSVKHDPSNLEAVMAVWGMMRLKGEVANKARAALRAELTRGQANALIHVALGMDAWDREENKEALVHLEQAYRLAPEMMVVANNLAWVLAHSQPPDLERALKLINSVMHQARDNPICRDTRGFILAKMKRWREALPDLQEALKAYPERAELHANLAEAYRNLGLSAMAAEHTRIANDLRKQEKAK